MSNLQPGQSFGPYSIINQIGSAGNVTAYKAYDSGKARDVTLKVFSSALAQSTDFATRLAETLHATSRLNHAHILPVYDAGQIDGMSYVVTRDLSDLRTLTERLASGALSPTEITQLLKQVAEALSYVHAQGVAHGALNPDNILLDSNANISLADFGLANLLPRASAAYTSPEQARDGAMDARADTYALGVVLYTMVAGRAPSSEDTTLGDALKQLSDSLPWPSNRRTEFALKGESVIRKALSANPRERFASVADLLDAWQRAQTAASTPTLTPSQSSVTSVQATAQRPAVEARAKVEQAALVEAARKAKEEAERIARARIDPQKRDALRNVLHQTQAIAAQKVQEEKARLARAAEEARNKAQATDNKVSQAEAKRAAAIMAARVAAANELKTEAERKAQSATTPQARTAVPSTHRVPLADVQPARRRARPIVITLIAITLTVCVGLPALCIGAFALIPDITPTPTRSAFATDTAAAKVNTNTPIPPPTLAIRVSPTLRPSATPTRDLTADVVLVFSDAFKTGECHLPEGDDEKRTFKCDNGEYTMLSKNETARWAYYDDEYRDIVIEVDARVVSGGPSLEYGVVWRVASNGESLYGFTLKSGGEASVFRYQNTRFTYFISVLRGSAFKPGAATNRLKVITQRNQMEVFVNDQSLISITDSALQKGAVGFFIKSASPSARTAFSNLRISEIGRPPVSPAGTPLIRATATR